MSKINPNDWLRPRKGRIKQKRYVGFDIETEGISVSHDGVVDYHEYSFISLATYDASTGEEFFTRDVVEAREWMLSPRWRGHTFVATNLGYDYCGLFWGTEYWNKMKRVPRAMGGYMGVSYDLGSKRGSIHFEDTTNFVPFGVEKIGCIVGFPKLTPPSWLGERSPRGREEVEALRSYNVRDARISAEFMVFLQDAVNHLGGEMCLSIASTALDLFLRRFFKGYIVKEHVRARGKGDFIESFVRDAYYGGRTECFKRGRVEKLNYYDVNSLYPSVMRGEYPLPQSARVVREPSVNSVFFYHGVSDVTVRAPEGLDIPFLPYRGKDKLLFPLGVWRAKYNHVDLRAAVGLGYEVLAVHQQVIYTESFTPFKEYVEVLYAERRRFQQLGSPMELACKLLSNSLYGKFSQGVMVKEDLFMRDYVGEKEDKIIRAVDPTVQTIDFYDDYVLIRSPRPTKSNFCFPILSSMTTSYARILMYGYLGSCNPYYTDTDSLMTADELPTSNVLGALKLEFPVSEGVLCKAKLYRADDRVRAKGIRGADRMVFERLLSGESISQESFVKPRTAVRRGLMPNSTYRFFKRVDLEDDKRSWAGRFNPSVLAHSKPLIINEGGGECLG